MIGTTRSTTHRLARCLVDERYLRVVPQVGYLLGPKLIELGFQAREELPLVNLAVPYLDELSALTGDTIHLAIREYDDVLYLHKNPGRNGGPDVFSLGADGKPGGDGDNADIYN